MFPLLLLLLSGVLVIFLFFTLVSGREAWPNYLSIKLYSSAENSIFSPLFTASYKTFFSLTLDRRYCPLCHSGEPISKELSKRNKDHLWEVHRLAAHYVPKTLFEG